MNNLPEKLPLSVQQHVDRIAKLAHTDAGQISQFDSLMMKLDERYGTPLERAVHEFAVAHPQYAAILIAAHLGHSEIELTESQIEQTIVEVVKKFLGVRYASERTTTTTHTSNSQSIRIR